MANKLFQISEDDLATLEAGIPALVEALAPEAANRKDTQDHIAMLKKAVSDVRWNYGPHTHTEEAE